MQLTIEESLQALIPPLSSEEYAQLEANILAEGCRDALVVWDNTIIDGHNRYQICTEHNLPFGTEERNFANLDEAKVWMIDNQRGRRNLTDGWKFELAQAKKALLTEKHEEERLERRVSNIDTQESSSESGRTRNAIAADLGWSTGKVAMADKVWKEADDKTKEAVKAGEVSINQAYTEVKREKKKKEVERRIKQANESPIRAPSAGPYDLILADPPWRYDFSETKSRDIENNYPTATVEDICSHKPDSSDHSILLLWATAPKILEAFRVMEAWGFTYKTQAVWDKEKIGMGYWFRGQHEILIVATKGNPSPPPPDFRVSSVFREARGKHSKKPECVYKWIEQAFHGHNKLEMYCRQPRDGWGAWGNEV